MTRWHARRRQRIRRDRESGSPSHAAAAESLRRAWAESDALQVTAALTTRAVLTLDSGGALPELEGTVTGRTGIADALIRLRDMHRDLRLESAEVNGGPGIVLRSGGRVVGVVCTAVRGPLVDQLWAVVNPDKLTHWNPV